MELLRGILLTPENSFLFTFCWSPPLWKEEAVLLASSSCHALFYRHISGMKDASCCRILQITSHTFKVSRGHVFSCSLCTNTWLSQCTDRFVGGLLKTNNFLVRFVGECLCELNFYDPFVQENCLMQGKLRVVRRGFFVFLCKLLWPFFTALWTRTVQTT